MDNSCWNSFPQSGESTDQRKGIAAETRCWKGVRERTQVGTETDEETQSSSEEVHSESCTTHGRREEDRTLHLGAESRRVLQTDSETLMKKVIASHHSPEEIQKALQRLCNGEVE